jgi:hypothetical protein
MIDLRKKDDMIAAIEQILQQEALKGNQHLIDKNKNNKVDPEDFKILRGEKKTVKEEETVDEGIKELAKKAFKAVTGGSDEDQRKDLQRKMGLPQTGKKPTPQKEEVVDESLLGQLRDRGNVATGQKQQDRKNFDTNTGAALKPNSTISGIRAKMQNKVQEEAEEVDESKGMPLHRRRGNALNSDADKLAKRDKPNDFGDSPRYPQGKNLLKVRLKASQGKHTTPNLPEDIELIDELSKSTLGSYIKKAAADSTISRKIGADFENRANSKRSPAMKDASTALSDKFKSDSRKRKANVDKAVDRLTKEEKQPKTLRQFKEGWEEMMADVKKRAEPKPNGGSGVKQGSRYGGSKQKDTPEQDTEKK